MLTSSSHTASVQELDPNFREPLGAVSEEELRWVDASTLTVEGVGWPRTSDSFCRLPDSSAGVVRDEMWRLSRCSAGICVRFISTSPTLAVRWNLRNENLAMTHMPATGVSGIDLYIRDPQTKRIRWAAIARPETFPLNCVYLLQDQPDQLREYFLYLPLYNGVSSLHIGVEQEAELRTAQCRSTKPICFYGASIVQGACASRPGMALPALLGRRLDRACWNFGFSGNSHAEPEMAALLAELDPALYAIGPAPSLKAPLIIERLEHFLRTLRAARRSTPIVLVESPGCQQAWTNPDVVEKRREVNSALRAAFEKLKHDVSDLHFIEAAHCLGDDGEATVDGTHPNDAGFLRMADALAPALEALL